jgi:hemolysin III
MSEQQPQPPTDSPLAHGIRPRWRGVLHQYAFFGALAAGLPLILTASSARATVAAGIYVASLVGLLGTSALYHRIMWQPRARYWMGQVDTSMIFVLIAGSFTPLVLLLLQPKSADTAFWAVWFAAVAAIVLNVVSGKSKKSFNSIAYVAVASIGALLILPRILSELGGVPTTMFAAGGLLYILGAVAYGLERPNPLPAIFGYHEVFHALVVLAAGVHFTAIAMYVMPA